MAEQEPGFSEETLAGICAGSRHFAAAVEALVAEIHRLREEARCLRAAGPQTDADGVVFLRRTLHDWRIEQGLLDESELPAHVRGKFEIRILDRGDGGVEVQLGHLGDGSLQRLAAGFKVEDGQPSISIRGANVVPGHGSGILDATGYIDTDGPAQSHFVLPDGQLVSRAPAEAMASVSPEFLPGDAAPVIRQALAGEGYAPLGHNPALARGVRFSNVERYVKVAPLTGTPETLVLTIEVSDEVIVLVGGTDKDPTIARREQRVSAHEGIGSALNDLLQVSASITSEVRDHVQRSERVERI